MQAMLMQEQLIIGVLSSIPSTPYVLVADGMWPCGAPMATRRCRVVIDRERATAAAVGGVRRATPHASKGVLFYTLD